MYLNDQHINHSVPEGTFGGAMCTCEECIKMREERLMFRTLKEKTTFQPHNLRIRMRENPSEWDHCTDEDLRNPQFLAIWSAIKEWDINVPSVYSGYAFATGNHVIAIMKALGLRTSIQKESNEN